MAKKTIYNVVNSVKGGCGKTTFSVYLAWKAANEATNKNTLLIDMDFQGTAMEFLFHGASATPKKYLNDAIETRDLVFLDYIHEIITEKSDEKNNKFNVIFSDPKVETKSKYRVSYQNNYTPVINYQFFRYGLQNVLDKAADCNYENIILDMPPNSDGFANSAIDYIFSKSGKEKLINAERNMFLVTTTDAGHIDATIKELTHILKNEEHMLFDKLFIVINHHMSGDDFEGNSKNTIDYIVNNVFGDKNSCFLAQKDYKNIYFINVPYMSTWHEISLSQDGICNYKSSLKDESSSTQKEARNIFVEEVNHIYDLEGQMTSSSIISLLLGERDGLENEQLETNTSKDIKEEQKTEDIVRLLEHIQLTKSQSDKGEQ